MKKSILINSVLVAASFLISLFAVEGIVRLVLDPVDYLLPRLSPDPILGHKILPGTGGHDDWGFRNLSRPETARIVAIGDSMTYGIAAMARQSWPSQLSGLSGTTVYNMALGGYGALEYLHLLREKAVTLKPEVVVVGLYVGNDFMDVYNRAYSTDFWKDYRLGEAGETEQNVFLSDKKQRKFLGSFRNYLARSSVAYRLVTRSSLFNQFRAAESRNSADVAASDGGALEIVLDDQASTFLYPDTVEKLMNTGDGRIEESLKISEHAYEDMKRFADQNDIRLIVVMFPSKEFVYFPSVNNSLEPNVLLSYSRLIGHEEEVRAWAEQFFDRIDVGMVDAAPALRKAVEEGQLVYPATDGHPNAMGYSIIASLVYDQLK